MGSSWWPRRKWNQKRHTFLRMGSTTRRQTTEAARVEDPQDIPFLDVLGQSTADENATRGAVAAKRASYRLAEHQLTNKRLRDRANRGGQYNDNEVLRGEFRDQLFSNPTRPRTSRSHQLPQMPSSGNDEASHPQVAIESGIEPGIESGKGCEVESPTLPVLAQSPASDHADADIDVVRVTADETLPSQNPEHHSGHTVPDQSAERNVTSQATDSAEIKDSCEFEGDNLSTSETEASSESNVIGYHTSSISDGRDMAHQATPTTREEMSDLDQNFSKFVPIALESSEASQDAQSDIGHQSQGLSMDGETTEGLDPDSILSDEEIRELDEFLAVRKQADVLPELEKDISKTLYIMGMSSTGIFIAHALAGVPNPPPLTLIFENRGLLQRWSDEGSAINVLSPDGNIRRETDFKIEVLTAPSDPLSLSTSRKSRADRFTKPEPGGVIDNLILATGQNTVSCLLGIKHRLRNTSTICFMQDGLGFVERVNAHVFPDPGTRPRYVLASLSHALYPARNKFSVLESRSGTGAFNVLPRQIPPAPTVNESGEVGIRKIEFGWATTSRYLMRTFSRIPDFTTQGFTRSEYFKMHLQKIAINSVLGPLSVIHDCSNDQLLNNYHISRTMKMVLKEISQILLNLPELARIQKLERFFSAAKLESIMLSVIVKTGKNRTTMLQAVEEGRKTDVDFYNGYLIYRASQLGLPCPHLEMLLSTVKAKQALKSKERNRHIPFEY